jgi:hypothetical protein
MHLGRVPSDGGGSRGEDPLIATLVADETLERIMQQQTFMLAQSAEVHVARIRDWRESRPVVIYGSKSF